jgi:hypothetical protein
MITIQEFEAAKIKAIYLWIKMNPEKAISS